MPFAVALSGLNAASSDLSVTANNIANANTTGFKASRAEFADVFAVGAQNIGNGVAISSVTQEFSQGGVDFTDRGLDLAISGEGFFTMSDRGVISYTRAGSFGVDRDGFVVNSQGSACRSSRSRRNGTFNTGTLTDLAARDGRLAAASDHARGVRHQPARQRGRAGRARVRPRERVELQPLDGRDDLRLARRLAHGNGVLREDGDGEPMGSALLHRRHGRRRRQHDDVLEPGRADGARRRRHHAAGLHAGERRRADHDDRRLADLDAVRRAVRREPAAAKTASLRDACRASTSTRTA